MKIQIRVREDVAGRLRDLAGTPLEKSREELVRASMVETLQRVIERNPVDTGRSRAAWVNSLEQLGGSAPSGWEGPHPTEIEAGRRAGTLSQQTSRNHSEISVTSHVPYVVPLEYGTSRMSPFAMVRSALLTMRSRLKNLYRFE